MTGGRFVRAAAIALGACVGPFAGAAAPAPAPLPVLRGVSRVVDVRDGDRLLKGVWQADPAVALDRYDARRSARAKRVTFVSDVDSLSFDVQPGALYDFVILLVNGDSCRTRLSTMTQSSRRAGAVADTLPITIEHGKLHVRGSINDSKPLDLIFDTGADQCVLYPSATRKGARLQFDGEVVNVGTGGATRRRTSSDNRLQVAGVRWDHEPVMYVEKQADRGADGIVGFTVFQDRVVEFDYDRMVMVVHDSLPPHAAGFSAVPMRAAGTLTAVEAVIAGGGEPASGRFILDTAGNGTLAANSGFATAHDLYRALRKLGTSGSRGVGSRTVRNQVALVPLLQLAGFTLRNVPVHLELPAGGVPLAHAGTLHMDVLSRFDTILDYPHDTAYFRPNERFDSRFKRPGSASSAATVAVIAMMLVVLLASRSGLGRNRRPSVRPPTATP